MKVIKFLLKNKLTRRLIDSLVKNYFLARKINIIFLNYKNLKLEINMEDSFDRVFLFKGYWEDDQIDYLINYSNNNLIDMFIDIGSNAGLYSLMFAKNNLDIKILSYEPIKTTYEKQKRNIKLNNLNQNIEVFNYGLSNRSGEAYFETKTSYNYKQSSTYKVSSQGDQVCELNIFDKISNIKNNNLIIKIDVEGHEKQVLEGMERTLSQNSVLLQIEIFDENFENINNFLLKQGFHFLMKISSDHYYKKS